MEIIDKKKKKKNWTQIDRRPYGNREKNKCVKFRAFGIIVLEHMQWLIIIIPTNQYVPIHTTNNVWTYRAFIYLIEDRTQHARTRNLFI